MSDPILFMPMILSFFIALFLFPYWIRKTKQIGLFWKDMNKIKSEKVAGSGGIIITISFIISVLFFVAYRTFILKDASFTAEILAALLVITLLAAIGFVDDLFGWQKGGLSRRSRLVLVAAASIPLMVINAGKHSISIPFLGNADLGIIYPLLLIPLGIVGASTTFNFLAGFNGLEAGQGILILSAVSIVAYFTGNSWLAILGFCMVFSLLAFLLYNFYPAKIFPGDTLTYPIGGLIAIISILGNFEKVALFFFAIYFLEIALKSRGKLIKHSFGKPTKTDELEMPYDKIYGLTHLSIFILKKMNIRSTEKNVVFLIWAVQIAIIILGFIIFSKGIFLI